MGRLDSNGLAGSPPAADASELKDMLRHMQRTFHARRALSEAETMAEDFSTLLDWELDLLRHVSDLRADTLEAIIGKLAIWELAAEDHDEGATLENAIVRSVLADLRRLERRPR